MLWSEYVAPWPVRGCTVKARDVSHVEKSVQRKNVSYRRESVGLAQRFLVTCRPLPRGWRSVMPTSCQTIVSAPSFAFCSGGLTCPCHHGCPLRCHGTKNWQTQWWRTSFSPSVLFLSACMSFFCSVCWQDYAITIFPFFVKSSFSTLTEVCGLQTCFLLFILWLKFQVKRKSLFI